jgi:exopolysaccharide biosynthesis polyprenyl glycosylphosphotransferase
VSADSGLRDAWNAAKVYTQRADAPLHADLLALDERTRDIVARRRSRPTPRRRRWLLHRALAGADTLGLLVAFVVAAAAFQGQGGDLQPGGEIALFLCAVPIWILLAKLHGLYDQEEEGHSALDDITGVFNVSTIGIWLVFLVSQATAVLDPSLARMIVFWLLAVVVIPLARAVARVLCRRSLAYAQNTVVVGTGPAARHVARRIRAHPESGLNLVGFVDGSPDEANGDLGGLPLLGTPDQLRELVQALDLERIVVGFTHDGPEGTLALVRSLRDLEVQIDIVPRLYEAVGTNSTVHMIGGMPLVGLPPIGLSPSSRLLKRALDIVGAALGLMLLSPLFVAISIAIKLDSPGPVFFRQLRRGERETTFRIFKFRTMFRDAEARKSELAHLNMHELGDPRMFKIPNDPRITRVGDFLRRTSLDELPQLLNVLKGEMSLVGPRPLILSEDDHVLDWARKRLELRPGITGVWQVLGRSDIPFGEMTQLDYLYVTSWSLKEDIRLMLLTLPSLMRQRKAF